jgi:hypothetical protein
MLLKLACREGGDGRLGNGQQEVIRDMQKVNTQIVAVAISGWHPSAYV